MRRRTSVRFALLVVIGALAVAGAASAQVQPLSAPSGSVFVATMTGFEEVNARGEFGQGDLDAFGTAIVWLDPATDRACWIIIVTGMLPATAAHIHIAPRGVPGPIVVPLSAPDAFGLTMGCITDPDVDAVAANPANFYVNVHNAPFPAGAVRGQLVPR